MTGSPALGPQAPSILVVCTANQCRSPMAEVLLRRRLPGADVRSAAVLGPGGVPASEGSVRSMANIGIDISGHRSRVLDPGEVEAADLVLCMARLHLREVVVRTPGALAKSFTLKEIVRLAELRGPRDPGVELRVWIGELGQGRRPGGLLADVPTDDVADPMGQRQARYDECAIELDGLVDRLASLVFDAP